MAGETQIDPAGRCLSVPRHASELAERQFGAIARPQLLAIGVSSSRVERWLADGHLHRRYPGVYAYGRPDLPVEGDLACGLLFSGMGSALTGLTQLWWLELLHRRPGLIHLDALGRRASRQDLLIRHPSEISRILHRGLPVTSLSRSLLLATESLTHNTLRLVLARAEFHRHLNLSSLQSAIAASPRGSIALRGAMDSHLPQLARCTNELERNFVLLCERFRLAIPEPNARIGRFRPDMLWRDHRLIVELDGKDAHSTPAQLAADSKRQSYLEALGFTVIRFTWEVVEFEPARVAATTLAHLSSRTPRKIGH